MSRAVSRVIFLICILAAYVRGVAGDLQVVEIKDTADQLVGTNAVLIHNRAGQEIVFYLSSAEKQARRIRIGDNDAQLYSDGASTTYLIEIPTEGKNPVRYQLLGSKRYQIYWNGDRWDVDELVAR